MVASGLWVGAVNSEPLALQLPVPVSDDASCPDPTTAAGANAMRRPVAL